MSLVKAGFFDGLRLLVATSFSPGALSHSWQAALSILKVGIFEAIRTCSRERAAVLSGLSLAGLATSAWWISRRTPQPLAKGDTRLCVVTGAASGIGLATVLRLESLEWHVLAVDVDEKKLTELDERTSKKVHVMKCDVSSSVACDSLVQHAKDIAAALGVPGIAALANIAGVMQHCPAAAVSDEQLRRVFAVNCEAPVRLVRMFMPMLLATERPTVCNVASLNADTPMLFGGCYSATKGFLNNYTDSLRREAAAAGLPLRVCCVKPGFTETPLTGVLALRQLDWCEQNPDSPFQPPMKSSAEFRHYSISNEELPGPIGKFLKPFLGDPSAPFRSPPEDVAEDIARTLCIPSPSKYYCTGTIPFKILIGSIRSLPGTWEDWAIKFIC